MKFTGILNTLVRTRRVKRFCVGLPFLLVLFCIPSHADTNWINAGTGDWTVDGNWSNPLRHQLELQLQEYIPRRRWFGAKARPIKAIRITETVTVPMEDKKAFILFVDIEYVQGDPDKYLLPLACVTGAEAQTLQVDRPHLVIAEIDFGTDAGKGCLFDALGGRDFALTLLNMMSGGGSLKGISGDVKGFSEDESLTNRNERGETLEPTYGRAEQSNSAILFGDKFILKTYRRLEAGINPDLEVNRFLSRKQFPYSPPMAGGLTYRAKDGKEISLGILSGFVANCRDGWEFTVDALGRYYERVMSLAPEMRVPPPQEEIRLEDLEADLPVMVGERLSTYVETARLLGERTAQMLLCLGSDKEDKEFAPEAFTQFYQRSLFQSMRNMAVESLNLLRRKQKTLTGPALQQAQAVLGMESEILKKLRLVADVRMSAMRLRVHGDYHLGQVLHTGKDFLIIDFEGEPSRSLSERRFKRTPLSDVAGMLRSFDYAANTALFKQEERGVINKETTGWVTPWSAFWAHWTSVIFLKSYLGTAHNGGFLPKTFSEMKILLDATLLQKSLYELRYELNNRPAWIRIPLQGISRLMEVHRNGAI